MPASTRLRFSSDLLSRSALSLVALAFAATSVVACSAPAETDEADDTSGAASAADGKPTGKRIFNGAKETLALAASSGTTLTVSDSCESTDERCSWRLEGGRLAAVVDLDAVVIATSLEDGAPVALGTCAADKAACKWTYGRDGLLVSAADPTLALAIEKAENGQVVRVKKGCTTRDPRCVWFRTTPR